MNLEYGKDGRVYKVYKIDNGVMINMDGEDYAKTNTIGDLMILKKFSQHEYIVIDSSFLDMINNNRYLVVNIDDEFYKANLKELTNVDLLAKDYVVDKNKLKKVKITVDKNNNIN